MYRYANPASNHAIGERGSQSSPAYGQTVVQPKFPHDQRIAAGVGLTRDLIDAS